MLLMNDMHVTIDPRPVQPVNHCFTTCTGRTSRTSRVKPFTGRIRSTLLDKDEKSHLTVIFNKSLHSAEVLEDWKKANVAPVFKKGERYNAENYRPISLTCIASKIMEHILTKHIMKHLESTTYYTNSNMDLEQSARPKPNF